MALTTFLRFGSRRPKASTDAFDILGDLVPWQESVDANAALTVQTGMRNLLINGSFVINQRGYASAGALAVGAYGLDRWKSTTAASSMTFTAAPNGQPVTINAGGSFAQVVERASIAAGTFVLSWAGTATARVYNSGAVAPAYAASPVVVTIDGTTDVVVEVTASGAAQTFGTAQLEVSTAAAGPTPFERRPIGMELALCQRYFWRLVPGPVLGRTISTTQARNFNTPLPVTPRATPTVTVVGALAGWTIFNQADAASDPVTVAASANSTQVGINADAVAATFGAGGQAVMFTSDNGGTNYLDVSAEL